MKDFIKYEVWEDYWCFKPVHQLDLSKFQKLNYTSWTEHGKIQIRIESNATQISPNPNQIKTLNYIDNNEDKIIKSIFDYYQKVILPVFKEATDIEENEIANNQSELSRVFGIRGIEIPQFNNSDSNYYLIEFDFRYDSEHGLYILFDNLHPIDFFGEGDKNYDAISFFQYGLKNDSGEPIKVNLYDLNGETVFQEYQHYDKLINFDLKKGTYRAFVTWNEMKICRNFYVPNDVKEFTLREIFTYK